MNSRLAPRPSVLFVAALAGLALAAAGDWSTWHAGEVERALMSHDASSPADPASLSMLRASLRGTDRVWPDPVRSSWLEAFAALRDPTAAETDLRSALEAAVGQAPRAAAPHFYLSRLLGAAGDREGALEEQHRAIRCDPHHGLLRAEIAKDQLLEAVRSGDESLLEESARGFAVSVTVGQMSFDELVVALEAAGAPLRLFEQVAASRPDRLQALVEHHAQAGRYQEAVRLGTEIDRLDGATVGRVLAHLRVAAALRRAGDDEQAVEHFARAAELSPTPERFALDRADALLATGRIDDGIEQLLRAADVTTLSPARLAGSLAAARDPQAAVLALAARAPASRPIVRLGVIEAVRRLHDPELGRALRDRFALTVEVSR